MDKSSDHLTIYLDQIHLFLIGNDDSIVFPSLTMSIEDILVNIAKDTNFLKQSRFGEECKSLAAKLLAVLDKNKDVFTLCHEFKFDDKRKKVMVYKKIPVRAFQEPISVPSKPLRKPNSIKEKTEGNTPKSVMSSFKITFLNATLKFVKDDSQMVLSYPNMSSDQADFVKQTIDQCMERDGTKAGFKGLYDPLAEALKIFSLKYDYKLSVGTLGDMKKLRFEKKRKITDTKKREGTRIIYELTSDSDSSQKQVSKSKSKSQKQLTTLIDALSQITAEFKLCVLTELRNFLKDKNTSVHTFSNLSGPEQQFISHWQALAERVEVVKMFDVQGLMVLDEIRGFLKKRNFRVKVELGMTASRDRFAKLTKVFNPNNVKLTEEEKIARLKAMVLPTQTRRATAAENSSSNSSSDSNSKPQNKFERKVAQFFRKTKGVKNDWIQATLTRLRDFLLDEAQATLILSSVTELQIAFLAKWQKLLSEPEVINTYPTDVQVLMHEVRDVAAANKKFRVEFNLTKNKTGLRDARFAKLPAFCKPPKQIPKENIPLNILPKNKETKTENGLDTDANVNKTAKKNVLVNIQPKNNDNKTEKCLDSAANVNKTSKEKVLFNIPPKNKENKTENGTASIKNESRNKQITTAVKEDPKKGGKSEISIVKAVVPTNTKSSSKFEPNVGGNKGEVVAQKAAVPKATNLAAAVKLEQIDDKAAKTPANATKARDANELRSGSIANLFRTACKKIKAAENQRREVIPVPIYKSTSLTSLNQKDSRAKNASKVVRLPAATVKLIEALNQPLVSERGLKMMRQMGWEGGPLGARGEGIAEPLMLDLDLGKRAGLGAPKPNLQVLLAASKSTNDDDCREGILNSVDYKFKKDVMQTLLRMVKGDEPQKTEIKFDHELTFPDWNYVKIVATTFNNREVFPEGMAAVLARVADDELMLTTAWSCTKREILLIISKYDEQIQMNRERWSYVILPKETLWKRNRRRLVEVSARDGDKRVMVAGQAFKYYVMAQILEFCLNCNAESPLTKKVIKDIILKGTMVKKQRSYVRDVVTRVNNGARCSSDSVQEVAIHEEIISAMHGKGYTITVDFPSLEEISGEPVCNIISLTKTYGYKAKKVLTKLPPVKTEATTTNNCSKKENHYLQVADTIEKNTQELKKNDHSTKTTQDTDNENKKNNIPTANIIENKVKSPVVSEIHIKPNDKDVDETITNDVKINSGSETENTHKETLKANIIENKVKSPVVREINTKPNDKNVDETINNNIKINSGSKTENTQKETVKANIMENKVKSPVVSEINTKPNDKNVDEAITNGIKINSGSETENTHKETVKGCCNNSPMIKINKLKDDDIENKHDKTDKKDTGKVNTDQRKTAVDEETVSVEYIILEKLITEIVNDIENTDRLKGTEKNGHDNDKSDKTKGSNDKQNNHAIQLTSTELESVKNNNIIDKDLSSIDNEKIETNKNDNASRLIESIEKIANAKVDITSENESSKTVETEETAVTCQIKTDLNKSDKSLQLLESIDNVMLMIDNITSEICNVTINNDSFKATEEPVALCQIDKEMDRSEVEKIPPINDIITSLVEINIAENTKSEKVIDDSKDIPTVSPIEVYKENIKKDQTLKRLSKRNRSKVVSSDRARKRTKYDYVKHINIKPKEYPQTKITNKMAAEIQKSIQQSIDYTQVLPLLKCHGIQDGVLSYSCHNEKSLEIIQNVLKPFDLNITLTEESEKGTCQMSLKLNTFIDETVESIFNNLETFNLGLSTKDWVVIKKERFSDFLVIFVDMDLDSYKFIRDENFKLYAGIDEAQFSIVWD